MRAPFSDVSSFIDGSNIYGPNEEIASLLRAKQGIHTNENSNTTRITKCIGGKLRLQSHTSLPIYVTNVTESYVTNLGTLPTNQMFLLGDAAGNANPPVLALSVLFLREHNRLCDELLQMHPNWGDELLYQEARRYFEKHESSKNLRNLQRMVIGSLQSIFVNEYLPVVLGHALPPYSNYNPQLNPGIDVLFSTAGISFSFAIYCVSNKLIA